MSEFFGQRTKINDANGKQAYVYDRVYVENHGKKIPGTILNIQDPYYPEFKILIDKMYWKNDFKPEYVNLSEGKFEFIESSDKNYMTFQTIEDFKFFCNKYDYHRYFKAC